MAFDSEGVSTGPLHNLRPIGGMPTKDGQWVRPDRLWRSAAPLARREEASAAAVRLGVGTVVDLRDAAERMLTPGAWAPPDIRVHVVPVFRDELAGLRFDELSELYALMIDEYPGQLAEAFSAVARGLALDGRPHGGNVLVHCTAGKDRTGVLSGLLLDVLGVGRERILADFSLSQRLLGARYLADLFAGSDADRLPGAAAHKATSAPPVLLSAALAEIDRRGGTVRFLLDNGVAPGDIDRLRSALLVTAPHASAAEGDRRPARGR